jgi:hypothetical protein
MKPFLSVLALAGVIALLLFSCVAIASDPQGAFVLIATFPAMLALLSLSAWLERGRRRWGTIAVAALVLPVFLFAPIPGLNLYTAAWVGGVSKAYELVRGETPYAASHRYDDLRALVLKALEGDQGTLDLRGLHARYDWNRLCIFGPYTTDDAAREISGLPADWPLSTYSRVGLDDGVHALVLIGDRYPVAVADLPRNVAEFAEPNTCLRKEDALFRRGADGKLRAP